MDVQGPADRVLLQQGSRIAAKGFQRQNARIHEGAKNRGLKKMNISTFRIAFIDEGEDCTCWFYDEMNNQYYDGEYTGDYYEGDRVRVGWSWFGGENREVLWVERIDNETK